MPLDLSRVPIVLNNPAEVIPLIEGSMINHGSVESISFSDAFSLLFQNAHNHLQIVSPYIDRPSVERFYSDFVVAFSHKIEFTLVSRGVLVKEPFSSKTSYLSKLESIKLLWDIFIGLNPTARTRFVVRDYLFFRQDDPLRISSAVHQKIIVSDRKMAYIGSGELRRGSFASIGEVGTIMTGQVAEFISDLVQCYASVGTPVDPAFVDTRMLEEE